MRRIGKIVIDDKTVPPEVQPTLAEVLRRYEWCIPAWCTVVTVRWCPVSQEDPDHRIAETSIAYEYREAYICVFSSWLEWDDVDRRRHLLHELLHIALAPLSDYARDEIKRLVPKQEAPKYRATLLDELTKRCEASVQDLTNIIIDFEGRQWEERKKSL